MRSLIILSTVSAFSLSACLTVPEAPPPPVIIATPIQTCKPVSALVRLEIPAETKVLYSITSIDNPPYAPIESRVKQTLVTKQAQIVYVDSENQEVIDICENVDRGPVGPAPGQYIPEI